MMSIQAQSAGFGFSGSICSLLAYADVQSHVLSELTGLGLCSVALWSHCQLVLFRHLKQQNETSWLTRT